jgi:Protein of unknown function (DUF2809)
MGKDEPGNINLSVDRRENNILLMKRTPYILLSLLLFFLCILVVICTRELGSMRWWSGDIVIVILLYTLLQSMASVSLWKSVLGILLVAYMVEILQYFHFVELMGWQDSNLLVLIFGATFDWKDLIAYSIGGLIVLSGEFIFWKNKDPHV